MKIGTKIIATNSGYKPDVPNGTIMTVTHVFENNDVDATVDGGDGFNWYMQEGTFEEYTPALPYGHATMPDGRTVDLTANGVQVGLMEPDELQALDDHGGPYECWDGDEWVCIACPAWDESSTYRVAPKPVVRTEPREWLISMDTMHVQSVPSGFKPDGSATSYVHVREVIIDTKTEKL